MAPRSDFSLGEKIGKLQEAQKTVSENLQDLRKEVITVQESMKMCQGSCQKDMAEIRQSLDDIRNPKFSLRGVAHAVVKGAGWAGGAAVSVASIYELFLLIFRHV